MKDALANDPSRESYVVEIDGVAKFEFRVFAKALSAALQLKHDLPYCTIKLLSADETTSAPKQLAPKSRPPRS